MILHYLESAFRKIRRSPITSSINVLALALGFVCFIAAVGVSRYWAMSDQQFENADRIHVITQQFDDHDHATGHRPLIARPVATYLEIDFPMLEAVARIGNKRNWTVSADDRKATLTGARADADILKIFDFKIVDGNLTGALDAPDSVILTNTAAQKLFGDEVAVGRQVSFAEGFFPTVTAIIELPRDPSHMSDDSDSFGRFDFLYPWPADSDEREWWIGIGAVTYVLMPKDPSAFTIEEFRSQLDDFIERRVPSDQAALAKTEIGVLPLSGLKARLIDIQLFEGNASKLSIQGIITMLGLIVLAVACINYANLATAQAIGRGKEVGMRKVLGADSLQILLQYWLEALVLTVVAAVIAFASLWFLAPALLAQTGIDLRLGLFDNPAPIVLIIVLVFFVALLACAYPVVILAGVKPVDAIRQGTLKAGPKLASRALVTIQFLTASSLLILLLVINLQNSYLKESALLSSDSDVMLLTDDGSRTVGYEAIGNDLASNPNVLGTSYIDYLPWSDHENFLALTRQPDGTSEISTVFYNQVGYNFFELFSADLVAGRFFEPSRNEMGGSAIFGGASRADEVPVIVDRAFTVALGYDEAATAVGTEIYLSKQFQENFSTNPILRIIGVVEDMPLVLAASGTAANLYARADTFYGYPIAFLKKNSTSAGLKAVNAAVTAREPAALVTSIFFDDAFNAGFKTFEAINKAFASLSLIAMTISLLGLVGMAAFSTSRRRHEIGVRKTLGSTAPEIVLMLLKDFSKPVVVGNILAWPLAYYGAKTYLDNFIDSIEPGVGPWVAGLLITTFVAMAAIGGQSYSAARVLPADVLRQE